MSKTTFSISAVHRMTGKARSTISKHVEKGKISVVEDKEGNRLIEASEIIRVYGSDVELDGNGNLKNKAGHRENSKLLNDPSETAIWKELFEEEREERKRQREQLEETIVHLRNQLENADEREKHNRLLLEDKSQDSDRQKQEDSLWKKGLEDLKQRVANQEKETRKYRKALMEERSKSWWQKIWE